MLPIVAGQHPEAQFDRFRPALLMNTGASAAGLVQVGPELQVVVAESPEHVGLSGPPPETHSANSRNAAIECC
jgi:hypothetical protein